MMLSAIVLAMSAAVGIAFGIVSRTKLRWCGGWITALAMIAAIAGPILAVKAAHEIVTARAVKLWPTVEGIITKSQIVGDRAIRPLIFYEYRVGNASYSDSSSLGVPPFGNRRVRLGESETLTAEYKTGDSVKVYYDPNSPGHSTLYAREDWASYLRLTLGAILFGFGLLFLTAFGLNIRGSRQG